MDRLIKVNRDEFLMLIFALTLARQKVNEWDKWQKYNADIDPSMIDKLLQRLVDDRFVEETLGAESESMALAAALASQPPQRFDTESLREYGAGARLAVSPAPPDPAMASMGDAAERFRYASKSDHAKLSRVADRLRAITRRDGTEKLFVGTFDYTVRAVIEALELGDLFYEFPVNRSVDL